MTGRDQAINPGSGAPSHPALAGQPTAASHTPI